MTRNWQVYYHACLGAIGALIAWQLIGLIHTSGWNIHLANGFTGAGIGAMIGGMLGMAEGLLVRRSFLWAALGIVGGAGLGLLSGMVGLLLGGLVFTWIKGGLIARVLGWILFGAFLGCGLGLLRLSMRRALYGIVGGALGGLAGGLFYEVVTQLLLKWSDVAQIFLSAVGLVVVGLLLGGMIPLSVSVIGGLRAERGLIVYLNGPRQGMEIEVVGPALLGSSDACDVYIPDSRVERKQAELRPGPRGFEVANIGTLQPLFVGENLLTPGRAVLLADEALIQIGQISLRFQAG